MQAENADKAEKKSKMTSIDHQIAIDLIGVFEKYNLQVKTLGISNTKKTFTIEIFREEYQDEIIRRWW